MSGKVFPAVGQCIYCGASEYALGSTRRLADEHIIPLGIGGKFVLPEASCQKCERITGRIESIALNNHLLGPRRHLRLRGRTPTSKTPKELPVFVPRGGKDEKVMIPVEDHPSALFLFQLGNPPVIDRLNGIWVEPPTPVGIFTKWFNFKADILAEKYGISQWTPPAMDYYVFCRMLAKIGHAYAIAKLGTGSFHPTLTTSILEGSLDSARVIPFVGGTVAAPAELALHTLEDGTIHVAGLDLVGVKIRLFAQFGAPTYLVVVGTKGKRAAVLPIGFPIGGHVPYASTRLIVPKSGDQRE